MNIQPTRIGSQQQRQTSNPKCSQQEYMIHKNLPLPTQAKKCSVDTGMHRIEPSLRDAERSLTPEQQRCSSSEVAVYKQRLCDLKLQLEQYISDLNRSNQKYQECSRDRDNIATNNTTLNRENEMLRMQLSEQSVLIEQLNERIVVTVNKHNLEINQLSQNNEYQRRSQLDQQIRELTSKFNIDRQNMEGTIRQLNYAHMELENKCALLAQENERMHYKYNELTQELEQYRLRGGQYESEKARHNSEVGALQVRIKQLEWQFNEEQQNHNYQIEQHNKDRMKIVIQACEIERLWLIIAEADKYAEIERTYTLLKVDYEQLKLELINIRQSKVSLSNKIIELENEISQLITDIDSSHQRMKVSELQVLRTQSEVELLNQKLSMQSRQLIEYQKLSNQNEEKEGLCIQLEQLREQLNEQNDEVLQLQDDNGHLRREVESMKYQLLQQGDQCISQARELKMTTDQLQQSRQRINELKMQVEQQIVEINRSNHKYTECCRERDGYIEQMQVLQREYDVVKMQLLDSQSEEQNMRDNMLLQSNKHELELNELRQQCDFQRRSLIDGQIRELTMKFNGDRSLLENQIRQLSQSKVQLENKCALVAQENERLGYQLNEQLLEMDKHKMQLEYQYSGLVDEQSKDRMRILVYCIEIERLWSLLNEFEIKFKQAAQVNTRVQELEEQYRISQQREQQLMAENDELYQQVETFETEVRLYQKNTVEMGDLETKFRAERMSWESVRSQLMSQLREQEQKVQLLNGEIRRWSQTAEERMSEIEAWKNKFQDNQLMADYDELRLRYEEQEQIVCELEQQQLHQKSQIRVLESQVADKQKEIEDTRLLMSRQRRQSEYSNKETEQQRRLQIQQQSIAQQLEAQLMQSKELSAMLGNENVDLKSQITLLSTVISDRDADLINKTNELNEKIREIDQLREKYQQRINNSVLSTTTIRTTSQSRQSVVGNRLEQENIDLVKSKQLGQIPKRQAMGIRDFNQE